MHVRLDHKAGPEVPTLNHSLVELQTALANQQNIWAQQLAANPACFSLLEQQVHQTFQQLADLCVAGLLAHAAEAPALGVQAKKN
jgi:hypothetical protein